MVVSQTTQGVSSSTAEVQSVAGFSASDLSFSIQFIIDEKIFVVLFPPAMKETGFALAISRICSKLEGFQSTAGNGVYGESSCSGALLAMVDTALEHRDRHIAAAFDLSVREA